MNPKEYKALLLTLIVDEVQKALIKFNETYVMPLEKEFDELQGENERLKRRMRVLEQNLSKGYKTSKRISELEEEVKRYRDMATKLRRDKVKLQDTIQRLRSEA